MERCSSPCLLASVYLARECYELRRDWKPIAAAPGAIDSIGIAIPSP